MEEVENGDYQHYKGGQYTVICRAKHTETGVELVIYTDDTGRTWARPVEMFTGKVEVDGAIVDRFEPIIPPIEQGA